MTTTFDAVLRSWPVAPWLWMGLLAAAAVYLRGWRLLRRRSPGHWSGARLAAYLAGLAAVFVALGSPVEPFAGLLLQVHMVQHVLLLMVAPPLLWLGAPLFPLVRGLPTPVRRHWAAPLLRSSLLRRALQRLSHPGPAWFTLVLVSWGAHLPWFYERALSDETWHYLQHGLFLAAGLVFWYPVVRPYPARPAWSAWLLVPYLILADVQNTALSALFTFADAPLYSHYAQVPRLGGVTALEDQAAAGVLMWVPGSIAYLVPLFAIGVGLLYAGEKPPSPQPLSPANRGKGETDRGRVPLPVLGPTPDLLRVPVLGRFLRWRRARPLMQLVLLGLALVVIADGLWGPAVTPLNLAGVLPWVHWRGLLVLGLLVLGNVFCMACPFLLPRTLARRWLPAGRPWPRWLRHKGLAAALILLFLWAYEAFALWDRPWLTAWIALGYFAAAFVIDGWFRHAAFCKYVCPIGQFNFVGSLVSPTEVSVRDPQLCQACRTKDCIKGGINAPGCELGLYLPRKAGNMDCTLCLDCIHACPHDNVGIIARTPGAELWEDPQRSGVGRFSRRPDLAVLILVLVFGAFANAAGMVAPVVAWQDDLRQALGLDAVWPVVSLSYLTVAIAGAGSVASAAWLARGAGGLSGSTTSVAVRFSYSLVPLGTAMWLAHYSFHLFTSHDAVVPAGQRLAFDLGLLASRPDWVCACCADTPGWLLRLELLCLDLGLLLSLYTGWRLSGERWRALLPWAVLMTALFALGVWLLLEPMQMRGTLRMPG